MAEKEEAYENYYAGTYTPFEPEFGEYFTGYRAPHSDIGAPTSPQTADQIRQATRLLNTGMKTVEVGTIDPTIFETIPKQHFKEMARVADLTGSEITVHGPMVDMAGFTQQGWSEEEEKAAERQIKSIMERAHELNPKGNVPVTFHGGTMPIKEVIMDEDGKERNAMLAAVNQETGSLTPIRYEERFYPERPYPEIGPETKLGKAFTPERIIQRNNTLDWQKQLGHLSYYEHLITNWKEQADELSMLKAAYEDRKKKDLPFSKEEQANYDRVKRQHEGLQTQYKDIKDDVELGLKELFNRAYKYSDPESGNKNKLNKLWEGLKEEKDPEKYLRNLHRGLANIEAPQILVPADKFAEERIAKTAASAVLHTYKKYGNKAPILALENYGGTVMTTADDAKRIIEATRKEFVNQAKQKGISESQAKSAAEKLIGATYDIGHMNQLRRAGFKEKDITEQTKKLAKYVKKMHLTDNFGYYDAHLPPGMGNVPYKESLKELEKAGIKVPQIVEAGGFFQHFRTSPHPYVLEALGSPLYTYMAEPYWNQIRNTYASYFSGSGDFMPDFHFRTYGSPSFSALPTELGGELPGERRESFGSSPME